MDFWRIVWRAFCKEEENFRSESTMENGQVRNSSELDAQWHFFPSVYGFFRCLGVNVWHTCVEFDGAVSVQTVSCVQYSFLRGLITPELMQIHLGWQCTWQLCQAVFSVHILQSWWMCCTAMLKPLTESTSQHVGNPSNSKQLLEIAVCNWD